MQVPLKITFRNINHSGAVEARIKQKAAELEQCFDRITSCQVVVEAAHRHQHKGFLYDVRIHIEVPNRTIVVNRNGPKNHAHEDVYVTIRDAFRAMGRQLEDHARTARGEVKTHEVPDHGIVANGESEKGPQASTVRPMGEHHLVG